jgi:dihydroorotate dehydrogenase
MMHNLTLKLLKSLPCETAHHLALHALKLQYACLKKNHVIHHDPFTFQHLTFANRLGLAAGFDKNADYFDALGALGFGFVEVGTVTPKPQPGNPKPRLFRLDEAEGIINRMGFNNKGMDHMARQIEKKRNNYPGILGINLGKNADTPLKEAHLDYQKGMQRLYPFANYITLNLSSPNTEGLRELQTKDPLNKLLDVIANTRAQLSTQHGIQHPIFIKIAPDLTEDAVHTIVKGIEQYGMDGIIATNTTCKRPKDLPGKHASESGGLSGQPLKKQATQILKWAEQAKQKNTLLIAAGGIHNQTTCLEKKQAGASLYQIYSSFVFHGSKMIERCLDSAGNDA